LYLFQIPPDPYTTGYGKRHFSLQNVPFKKGTSKWSQFINTNIPIYIQINVGSIDASTLETG
jgi:hypothetical protein